MVHLFLKLTSTRDFIIKWFSNGKKFAKRVLDYGNTTFIVKFVIFHDDYTTIVFMHELEFFIYHDVYKTIVFMHELILGEISLYQRVLYFGEWNFFMKILVSKGCCKCCLFGGMRHFYETDTYDYDKDLVLFCFLLSSWFMCCMTIIWIAWG